MIKTLTIALMLAFPLAGASAQIATPDSTVPPATTTDAPGSGSMPDSTADQRNAMPSNTLGTDNRARSATNSSSSMDPHSSSGKHHGKRSRNGTTNTPQQSPQDPR